MGVLVYLLPSVQVLLMKKDEFFTKSKINNIMPRITCLDENGLGIAGIEFSNETETLTTDSNGVIEFENGKQFARNTNIGSVTEVKQCIQDFLPSRIEK